MDYLGITLVLIVCAWHLILGLAVLTNSPRRPLHQSFFAFTIFLSGWLIANTLSNQSGYSQFALLFFDRLTFLLPGLALYCLLLFCLHMTHSYRHLSWRAHLVLAVGAIGSSIVSATPLVIQGVATDGSGSVIFGNYSYIFGVYVTLIFGASVAVLVRNYQKARTIERTRLQYLIVSLIATFLFALITNLLIPLITGNFSFTILGTLATVIVSGGFSYAIIKHKLFDLRLIVARSVAYVLLLVFVGAAYGTALFGTSRLFFNAQSTSTGQTVLSVALSLFLAITFQPLRRFFERITDRIFYRDQYSGRVVLDSLSGILVSELNLDRILSRTLDTLCREMKLQFGQFVIFNDDRVYRVEHFGPLPRRIMVAPELRRLGSGMVVADELAGGERKALLDDHGIRVSLALKTGESFVGYLLLGDKLSGDAYAKNDLQLLALVGKELAVGIVNAKSYAEIQAFNLTLQDKVNQATSRLRVANRHLKELDRTKDEFISMASHQLRTPLTTIKGYLSMMAEGDAGKMSATQKEFVGYAFDASERMVNLISDLLNVSRLEAGRFLIQTMPTDIIALVADEVRQLQSHAANKNIYLNFVQPTITIPPVDLDESKTRQVIMNFIDNAIYYTKEGGVTVSLSLTGEHKEIVRLEVKDTGIGVPEAAKKKLFTKFYRADNAQTVRPDGTGLGLYLARRVVADQGGTIIFNSSEGKGSTFGFELPIKAVTTKDHHHG